MKAYLPYFLKVLDSGGTSVGNHNRLLVGTGCCCQCYSSYYNWLLNNSLWRAYYTVYPCSWSYVYKFIQLYCTIIEPYIYKHLSEIGWPMLSMLSINCFFVLFVCLLFFFLFCLVFADSNNNKKNFNIERKLIYDALKCCFRHCISFNPPVWFRKN